MRVAGGGFGGRVGRHQDPQPEVATAFGVVLEGFSGIPPSCDQRRCEVAHRGLDARLMAYMERFSEPLSRTLRRTVGLALAIGVIVGLVQHRLWLVPITALLALWFTLGGHFVDLLCWNELDPRIPNPRLRPWARLVAWFIGGTGLYFGAIATRWLLTGRGGPALPWWIGGAFFIVAELFAHLWLFMRGQPSVYRL